MSEFSMLRCVRKTLSRHKRSYLRAKPGNGSLMAPATRNYLTAIKAKFKITGGAGYNSYNPL
jgi:hypothetical protein